MDPYIIAGIVIFTTLVLGVGLVFKIYKNRTRSPSIDTENLLEAIIPKPPEYK